MIANSNGEDDVINLAPGLYLLSRSGHDDSNATGDLDLTEPDTTTEIRGAGIGVSIIQAGFVARTDRILHVLIGASGIVDGVTIRGGETSYFSGGGIWNDGNLMLTNAEVTHNRATDSSIVPADGHGGGIHNTGTLNMNNSTVSHNQVVPTYGGWGWSKTWHNGNGGGISNQGIAVITNSVITNNSVGTNGYMPGRGGGIYNTGVLTVGNNTFAGNIPDDLLNHGGTIDYLGKPTAADDLFHSNEDQSLTVNSPGVLANDYDPSGDPLLAVLLDGPRHGDLQFHSDGAFEYTPNSDFYGTDTFTYRANDGSSQSNLATVTINVHANNDAPLARDESYSVAPNGHLVVAVPGVLTNAYDAEGDLLTAIRASSTRHGELDLRPDGSFTYIPSAGFEGTDSFTYWVSDGRRSSAVATVTINVGTITVTTTADEDDGSLGGGSGLSLREAIRYAPARSVIDLPAGVYPLTRVGIEEDDGATGDLDFHRDLVVRGADAELTVIDARPLSSELAPGVLSGDRAIHVLSGVQVALHGITLTGGRNDISVAELGGGAILNEGELVIQRSVIQDNRTVGHPVILPQNSQSVPRTLKGGAIYNTGTLTIENSTLSNNAVMQRSSLCGAFCWSLNEWPGGEGGAIWSSGYLTVIASEISSNRAGNGGAFHLTPTSNVTIDVSTISDNLAGVDGVTSGYGGGITAHGELTIIDSTIANNSATVFGGGIWLEAEAVATITGSTFHGNNAGELGGGLHLENGATLHMINSTVSGNSAAFFGGGIIDRNVADYHLKLTHVTVTENTAQRGGGLYLEMAAIQLDNSIVAGNSSASLGGDDISGGFDLGLVRARFSLVRDIGHVLFVLGSMSNLTAVDPRLERLRDNGGPTWTHAPRSASPVLDAGSNSLALDQAGDTLKRDQRGLNRAVAQRRGARAIVDMGAVETESTGKRRTKSPHSATPHASSAQSWHVHQASRFATGFYDGSAPFRPLDLETHDQALASLFAAPLWELSWAYRP